MNFEAEAQRLLELCRRQNHTVVTAESCTGGLIAAELTGIPGSSDIVWGGFVSYANDAKSNLLSVSPELIQEKGAVSREVVKEMCRGALMQSGASLAVAVSGIAGPGGGSPDKPVGTVWIAVRLSSGSSYEKHFLFPGSRTEVRLYTVREALNLCEKIILNESSLDSK